MDSLPGDPAESFLSLTNSRAPTLKRFSYWVFFEKDYQTAQGSKLPTEAQTDLEIQVVDFSRPGDGSRHGPASFGKLHEIRPKSSQRQYSTYF